MLAVATGIGERLVRDAVWYRGRCNWVGLDATDAHSLDRYRPVHRALGPALGDGSAGIALFLAELYAATDEASARRTALGALRRSLAQVDQLPAAAARGLYAGRLGVAYAAARCGVLLGEEPLLRHAARIARGRWLREPATAQFDLARGTAGTIAGLLALAGLLEDERLVLRADRLGDELAQAARRDAGGWSWPVPGAPSVHGLCGFAHGAAGAAWALTALHAVTGKRRHRVAAERALDYERGWFDPERDDWPDLRGIERREPRGSFRAPHAAGWCHGAPGIALSRLRAWRTLGDERCRAEASTALATTAANLEQALLDRDAVFTLCHGIAGSADVLTLGADLLPAEHAGLARRAGEIGAGRYATSVDGWPCAVPGEHSPALLTGDAGIGLLYLRLHDAGVPSALLIS